jgi:hypothetical protein
MMSSRTPKAKPAVQDPRYLQLWLSLEWPKPTDRVPVLCTGCGWSGRRQQRTVAVRPCPRCAGPVTGKRRRSAGRRPGSTGPGRRGARTAQVVHLADRSRASRQGARRTRQTAKSGGTGADTSTNSTNVTPSTPDRRSSRTTSTP